MTRYYLPHSQAKQIASRAVLEAPDGYIADISPNIRTPDQNSAQWPILEAWASQKQWPINGALSWLQPEDWKDILTSAFEGETNPRIAPGLNGGIVMLGRRTSKFNKKKFSDWLDWLQAASHHAGINLERAAA